MDFVIKKTTELSEEEKLSLLNCFIEVFEHERTLDEMYNQYINTPMGYSIHSLCIDNGRVVAAETAFPSFYWIGDQKMKSYITGDLMVRKEYRDGATYIDISMGLTSYMRKAGYAFVFGFPNENAYSVNVKGRTAVVFGRLDIYILPYRIGGIKQGIAFLNSLSKFLCNLWVIYNNVKAKNVLSNPFVHKDDETYNIPRYRRMDGYYNYVKNESTEFYYKIKTHDGIRTAFLIDVIGKSERRMIRAVKHIIKTENRNFDLLMYVGHLPQGVHYIGLIKIPRRFEPKHFYMTGKVYNKELDAQKIYNINNWDVNLSDYDLI